MAILTVTQTLELGLMLVWSLVSAISALLLAAPNSFHSTRHCMTQFSYLLFVYAGISGLLAYHLLGFFLMLAGTVLYYKQKMKLKHQHIQAM